MAETLTFMFSDIEDSSKLWDRHPEPMRQALAQHNALFKQAVSDHGGSIVKDRGDGYLVVFGSAGDAVAAALRIQRDLAAAEWEEPVGELRVRLGLHSGTAEARDGDYFGPDVNRAARLEAAAHGGQVLVSEATRALTLETLPTSVELRDLGTHTLRGLTRPERVYQLAAPGIPVEFPPPRTISGGRAAFPTFATSFIGRDSDIAGISDRLLDPGTRVLTLLGPGGIGKTRLATETAARVSSRFAGGAAFGDLAQIAEPDGIPLTIAQAIGVHPEGSAEVMDIIVAEISDPTLLVLDNFEHVIEGRKTVAELVSRCGEVTVLATSRSPLRIQGEVIYQMEPLGVESGNGAVPPAVGLFIDRAAEHGVQIAPEGQDGAAVRSIVERVDGLPLAIELVAARVRLLNVAELERKLSQTLSVVGGGAADLPERQQTIQSTIAWSVDALAPAERALFNRLAVFPAGATLEQIERVATAGLDGDPLDLVSALVDNSLVTVITDLPGGTRFRQLTVLREYAAGALRENDAVEATMSLLVDYYLTSAGEIGRALKQGGGPLAEVEADYANLASALQWSMEAGRSGDMVPILYDLWPVWFNGDRAGEAAAWVESIDAEQQSPELDWLHGMFSFQTGDYADSADRFQSALEGFEAAGDEAGAALTGVFLGALSPPEEGEGILAEADHFFEREGQALGRFMARLFISIKALEAGDAERALGLRRELVLDAEALGYDEVIAWSHWNLAVALLGTGQLEEAERENRVAFEVFAENRYHEGIGSTAEVAAIFATDRAQWAHAVLMHGACEAIWKRLGIRVWWEVVPLIADAMSAARSALGDDEYERLEAQGRELGVDELIDRVWSGLPA